MLGTFKKIWDFAGTEQGNIKKSIINNFIFAIFHMLQIAAIFVALNEIINKTVSSKTVWMCLLLIIVSIAGKIIVQNFSQLQQTHAGYFMVANKRIEIGQKIKKIPMGFFNQSSLGNLTGICTTVLSDVETTAPMVLVSTLGGFITTVVFMVYMLIFDWRMGLIATGIVILYCIAASLSEKKSRSAAPARQKAQAALVETMIETIQGMAIVKSFNLTKVDNKKVNKAIQASQETNFGMEKVIVPYSILQDMIVAVGSSLIIAVATILCINGSMELVYALMFIIISFIIFENIASVGQGVSIMRVCSSSMEQACAMDSVEEMDIEGKDIKVDDCSVEFKNVSFSYEDRKILDKVTFSIPNKTTTAIVGPSGSGKTTVCSLISRFWDVDGGSIEIGGHNVKEYKLESLMDKISTVFQDVYLFKDTIENNIKFGRPEASHAEVVEAARKACCTEFIESLPDGYNTVIGDGVTSLSGGERQRISIARAILKDAPIIILDEATANVDPENEKQLMMAISELTKDKTIIMIAHRLKTVRNANQILVLDGGNIVQKGTHEELIKQNGIYADFVGMREKAGNWKLG